MVFTSEAYGSSSEMTDFIIVFQDGRYIEGFTDEFGRKGYLVDTLARFADTVNDQQWVVESFDKLIKPTGESKLFGEKKYGWPIMKAKGYELSYLMTNEKSNIYLSKHPYSLLPIYLFNELGSEAKLPVNFDFSQVIPLQYWVVEDLYFAKSAGSKSEPKIRTVLKSVSPTEYFVNLSDYQLLK